MDGAAVCDRYAGTRGAWAGMLAPVGSSSMVSRASTARLATTGCTSAVTGPRDSRKVHADSHSRRLQLAQGCWRSQRSLALLHGSQLRRFRGRLWGMPRRVDGGFLPARSDILGLGYPQWMGWGPRRKVDRRSPEML